LAEETLERMAKRDPRRHALTIKGSAGSGGLATLITTPSSFAHNPGPTIFPLSFKIRAHMVFHLPGFVLTRR
jgi:hypothetical protein